MFDQITIKNLEAISVMENIARKVGTDAYVWGGFIPDIYSQKLLREHDDVEQLVLDLYSAIPDLISLFKRDGWSTENLENGDLKVRKDGAKMHLGHLELNYASGIGKWFHNGQKGQIEFPIEWLNKSPIHFMNMAFRAVTPHFQYALKKQPHLMNPDWSPREKDLHDIQILENVLSELKVDLESLLGEMLGME